jgi:large subunit ribosomal protein L25
MTAEVVIQGELRDQVGTGVSRELRRNGRVPAVIYGNGKENIYVSLPKKAANALFNTFEFKTKIVNLQINDKKFSVLPKEANLHPVTDDVEHIDFMFLDGQDKIRVNVPIYYSNSDKSLGIKRGGVLSVVFRNILVDTKANNIPEYIEISLENLVIGDVIRFSDIKFPEGVKPVEKNMKLTVAKFVGRREIKLDEEVAATAAEGETAATTTEGAAAAPAPAAAKKAEEKK